MISIKKKVIIIIILIMFFIFNKIVVVDSYNVKEWIFFADTVCLSFTNHQRAYTKQYYS